MNYLQKAFHYLLIPIYTCILFAGMYQLLSRTLGPESYVYGVLFDRGPAGFLQSFLGIYILLNCLAAWLRDDCTGKLLLALCFLCCLLIFLGLFGTTMGLACCISGFVDGIWTQSDPAMKSESIQVFLIGIAVSFDALLLASMWAVICLGPISALGIRVRREKATPPPIPVYS